MKTYGSHRITSLLMALFIFISSSGISLNLHYCDSELYDYSLIGEPKSCQKEVPTDTDNELRFSNNGFYFFHMLLFLSFIMLGGMP